MLPSTTRFLNHRPQPESPRPAVNDAQGVTGSQPQSPKPTSFADWASVWPPTTGAARFAVVFTRSRLALSAWAGDQDIAATVVKELMLNAAQHVSTGEVTLVLTVFEDQDLLIQVRDEDPHFKGFTEVTAGRKRTGLGLVQELGGEISWRLLDEGGKAVQVRLHTASE